MAPRKRATSVTKQNSVSGSHTINQEDGSAHVRFASSTSSSPSWVNTLYAKQPLKQQAAYFARFMLLLLCLMTISASLYTIVEPVMERQRADISTDVNERGDWEGSFGLLVLRIVVVKVGWDLGFDGTRVAGYLAYLKQPFWVLLFLCYNVSLTTIAIDIAVDLVSVFLAFSLIGQTWKPYPSDIRHTAIFKHKGNQALLSLLAINVLALSLYATASSGLLGVHIVKTFYPVPSVQGIHDLSLSTSALLVSLSGLIVPFLLSTPPKIANPNSSVPKLIETNSVLGRTALLASLTFLETATHILIAIKGATVEGAVGYAAGWAVATGAVGAAMKWVDGATVLGGEDKEFVEMYKGKEVVVVDS